MKPAVHNRHRRFQKSSPSFLPESGADNDPGRGPLSPSGLLVQELMVKRFVEHLGRLDPDMKGFGSNETERALSGSLTVQEGSQKDLNSYRNEISGYMKAEYQPRVLEEGLYVWRPLALFGLAPKGLTF